VKEILNSWKEISLYLQHDVRTCQRWEKHLDLPVHRYDNDSLRSRVFAHKSKLDEWLEQRKNNHNNSIKTQESFFNSKRSVFILLLVTILSAAVIITLLIGFPGKLWQSSSEVITIGIYPFESTNSSDHNEYFVRGVTNEISDYLILFENLKIIKLQSLQESSLESSELKSIRNYGKVDYFLKGDIQKKGDDVKLHYTLQKTRNNKIIVDNEIHMEHADIQQIKKTVAKQIHLKLKIPFNDQMTESYITTSVNQEAQDLFLKGNYILNKIRNNESDPWKLYHQGKYYYGLSTRESNELAVELFCAAINLDRNFDQACIGLAQCYMNYLNLGWDYDIKWLNKASDLLDKVSSNPILSPEYYVSLTKLYLIKYVYLNEETESKSFGTVKKGLELYPNHPNLNRIASYCYYLKYGKEGNEYDFKKALEHAEMSFWQNPFSLNNLFYTELLLLDGQFNKALEVCNFVKKTDSTSMADFRIGEIHYYLRNFEKSKSIFNQMQSSIHMKVGALYYLGMIAAQNKDLEKVQNIIVKLENFPKVLLDNHFRTASLYFGIGNEEKGFKYLEDFLNKPITQKQKFIYERYIYLDKNFDKYNSIIGRKYFE